MSGTVKPDGSLLGWHLSRRRCTGPRLRWTGTTTFVRTIEHPESPLPEMDGFGQTFLTFSNKKKVYVSVVTFKWTYYSLVRLHCGNLFWLFRSHWLRFIPSRYWTNFLLSFIDKISLNYFTSFMSICWFISLFITYLFYSSNYFSIFNIFPWFVFATSTSSVTVFIFFFLSYLLKLSFELVHLHS